MTHIVVTLNRFFWFLSQAILVDGLESIFFAVGLAVIAAIMWSSLPDQRAPDRGSFWSLIFLPLIWIFVGLWGGWFWRENGPPNPEWVQLPLVAAPVLMLILSGGLIWWLRGARLFTATFAILNFYFLFAMCLLSGMAITGDWL